MARPKLSKPAKGAVPGLFVDPKGRYWVSLQLKGKRVERLVGGKTVANKYLTKLREEARLAQLFPEELASASQANLTFADLCARFRSEDELTNKDWANHTAMESKWIGILGDMRWHELSVELVASQQAVWLGEGLSPGRINRYTTRLHKVLAAAARRRIIRYNPIAGYVRLREPRGRRRKLELREEPLLRAEMSETEWLFVEFAMLSGFRQDEQFRCRSEYIDLDANTISLPETKTVARRHEGRTIPMSQRLRRIVEAQLKSGSAWLFPNKTGSGPVDADNFTNRVFRPACRRAGIEDLRWHDLRRRCATDLHQRGWPIAAVQKYLGHKNSSTTDRYISVADSQLMELIKLMD